MVIFVAVFSFFAFPVLLGGLLWVFVFFFPSWEKRPLLSLSVFYTFHIQNDCFYLKMPRHLKGLNEVLGEEGGGWEEG